MHRLLPVRGSAAVLGAFVVRTAGVLVGVLVVLGAVRRGSILIGMLVLRAVHGRSILVQVLVLGAVLGVGITVFHDGYSFQK